MSISAKTERGVHSRQPLFSSPQNNMRQLHPVHGSTFFMKSNARHSRTCREDVYGGEVFQGVGKRHRIKHELSMANNLQVNEIAQHALDTIEKIALVRCIEAPSLFLDMNIPECQGL